MKLNDFFDQCHVYETVDKSPEWLSQRKTGIGGSEVSIILNINKYKTPYEFRQWHYGCLLWQLL